MIVFPNCKINLGLRIVGKRADGYHDIETAFYPLPLCDILEAVPSPVGKDRFTISGNYIPGNINENLCVRALQLLRADFPKLPALNMHLHKAIPTGGGLGGGSSDAAFTIQLIDRLAGLQLSEDKKIEYALRLGSDCPFFIINKPSLAKGRGEKMEPISMDLSAFSFLLVNPGFAISTAWAFSMVKPAPPLVPLREILILPPETWKTLLSNDFEVPVFGEYPELRAIRETLYYAGAVYAAMSGSGSTVFGMFRKNQMPRLFHDKPYYVKEIR